jgi:tripeptidyl-peptidase-1
MQLKQHRLDEMISSLYEVSDPSHARYGKHLSKEQVDELVRPHPDTTEAVDTWLSHHGISPDSCHRTVAGDWLNLDLTVEQAERMFGAKYEIFAHPETAESVVRTMSYSLPRALHGHIDVVTPTTYFGTMRSMKATSHILPVSDFKIVDDGTRIAVRPGADATVPSSCNSAITPACLRGLYNTANYVPAATSSNKIGIAGYLSEYANDKDLQTFFKKYRTDAVGSTLTHVQINGGGNDQNDPGVEANLDAQYTTGISYPTPNIYYS